MTNAVNVPTLATTATIVTTRHEGWPDKKTATDVNVKTADTNDTMRMPFQTESDQNDQPPT
jgi:hypothetical protein